MKLVRLGNRVINLDTVTDVWRDERTKNVVVSFVGRQDILLVLTGTDAEYLWTHLERESAFSMTKEN